MRLTIEHTTVYRYDEAVPYSLQRLRLTPSTGPTQTVRHWSVDVDGGQVGVSYNDQFDNVVKLVETEGERHEVKVTAKGEVVMTARSFRTQEANREDARKRLGDLLRDAMNLPARRTKSRLNRVGKAQRLEGKKVRGAVKAGRGKVRLD